MAEKKEQLRLTKSRWKLLREHIGKNIINSFQKIYLRNEAVEKKYQMSEELQIEEILEEANAYNLRKEVDNHAKNILQNNDILISRIDAYLMAYDKIINDNDK
jgi:CRISPR/Cas system-associated endonuclease Cas3-HD